LIITYKFRLYPTPVQSKKMEETIETCRRLYNNLLASRKETGAGFFVQRHQLAQARKNDKFLRIVQSHVLEDVVARLDKAYGKFYAGICRYPKFRRKGAHRSFTFDYTGFSIYRGFVRLSMVGDVRFRLHRAIVGRVKRATVIKDVDQWFVAFDVEAERLAETAGPGKIGVDLGLTNIVALSDGTIIENPRWLCKSASLIRSLQRQLSRKKKGSHNRDKARTRLAKAWRTISRQREDYAHKLSYRLAKENNLIVFENLRIRNMVRNHDLAQAIMDVCWGKLRQLTASKAERRGGRVVLVNPSGTSQKCSGCGQMNPKMRDLSQRMFTCGACGLIIDRDVNAARNILQAGQELARVEAEPLLVQRRRISKFGR
jgi:putative transposase